jgi:tRNA threonylcarbamoyladenosine biosynthesis protein TsaB
MIVLGIETSTDVCAVGVVGDGELAIEQSIKESHIHSEQLVPMIRSVVKKANLEIDQIDGIAVSVGPGSFTGLRVGMSVAKGLSFSLGKPLLGVETFQAFAQRATMLDSSIKEVMVVIDARQGEFYVGKYLCGGEIPELDGRIEIHRIEELSQRWEKNTRILTDRPEMLAEKSEALCEEVYRLCSGVMIARLGIQKLQRGSVADHATIEPRYLKDFVVRLPVAP